MNFELAITTAMKELNITKWDAIIELTYYMLSHGSIDDFKDFVNYIIIYQKENNLKNI